MPYTFIDVGWWMQLVLPLPARSAAPAPFKALSHTLYAHGAAPMLLTDLRHIGAHVARVLADERTLNSAVVVWEDARTQAEAFEIGARVSGEEAHFRAEKTEVSVVEVP